jgi:hypothetical protein
MIEHEMTEDCIRAFPNLAENCQRVHKEISTSPVSRLGYAGSVPWQFVYVEFVVHEVTLEHICLRVLRFSLISFIPPLLCVTSFAYHQRCIKLGN